MGEVIGREEMLPVIEMLCLANSRKRRGRCVAGIDLNTGKWIRPVSARHEGSLFENQFFVGEEETGEDSLVPVGYNPQWAAPFDLIHLAVRQPYPLPHHPEDWILDERETWIWISRGLKEKHISVLKAEVEKSDTELIFGGQETKVPYARFSQSPVEASLALIKLDSATVVVKQHPEKPRKQLRLRFSHKGVAYAFPLTDPALDATLETSPIGEYPIQSLGKDPSRLYAVVSLSEPFNKPREERLNSKERICYKIVATVLELPF